MIRTDSRKAEIVAVIYFLPNHCATDFRVNVKPFPEILDAGTLVLSGQLFVIFVSGELTFVSGAFCIFYFKI